VQDLAREERRLVGGEEEGVSMKPGPMALTRIPCAASSWARHFVSIHTPALLTL
jgi:hypothetical protein